MKNKTFENIVKIILLVLSTSVLIVALITCIDWWITLKRDGLITLVEKEKYVYLFVTIAVLIQLLLVYSISLFNIINRKWLKYFNIFLPIVGFISLISAFIIDYKTYYLTYSGDISLFFIYTILYYLPLIPSILIFAYDRKKLNI